MIAQTDFDLNEDMIYLIETLKVEGYWSSKTFTLTLQNKDIPLLTHIEEIVKNLKLNFYKRILLKIRVDDNTKKEDISLNWKNKKVNFHIEKNALPLYEKQSFERDKSVTHFQMVYCMTWC